MDGDVGGKHEGSNGTDNSYAGVRVLICSAWMRK